MEDIALTTLQDSTRLQHGYQDDHISPVRPRDSAAETVHLETEQDVKKDVFPPEIPTLSRQRSSASALSSRSITSRGTTLATSRSALPPTGIRKIGFVLIRHLKFVGPGLVSSVAYFDP